MKIYDTTDHSTQRRQDAPADYRKSVRGHGAPAADLIDVLQRAIDESPRMLAQRNSLHAAFGSAAPPAGGPMNQTGMPDQLKSGIEALSGMDLSGVRVNRNSDKPAQLNALAYAQGNEIHLGPGQEQHLPHEAWHVVQQAQGRVRPTVQMAGGMPVNDDEGLEREADLMGARAVSLAVGTLVVGKEQDLTANGPKGDPQMVTPNPNGLFEFAATMRQRPGGTFGGPASAQCEFGAEDSQKLRVAHCLEAILNNLKLPGYLGGGAAAALIGSGRAIKDLDYKMSEALQAVWRNPHLRDGVEEAITSGLEEAGLRVNTSSLLPHVLRLEVNAGEGEPIEISLTSTGHYDAIGTETFTVDLDGGGTTTVTVISRDDLLLDKLFAFAERGISDLEKLETDFIDIAATLQANPYPYVSADGLEERWVAYRKKWRREARNQDPYDNGYLKMASSIGLQVAMRSTVLTQGNLPAAKGLRWLASMKLLVGKFAAAVEKVAREDRLRLRDEALSGKLGEIGNESFQALEKREQSEILQRLARLEKSKERMEKKGQTRTTAYVSTSARLFDLWLEWGVDLKMIA